MCLETQPSKNHRLSTSARARNNTGNSRGDFVEPWTRLCKHLDQNPVISDLLSRQKFKRRTRLHHGLWSRFPRPFICVLELKSDLLRIAKGDTRLVIQHFAE